MRNVIVGGDGWIARTAIALIAKKSLSSMEEISVYGSRGRDSLPIEGQIFRISEWEPKKEAFMVGTFIPAAFITLDRFNEFGEQAFISLNKNLIDKAANYIKNNSPNCCILLSSGIVSMPSISLKESPSRSVYQALKIEEEERLKLECEKTGTSLVVCRLFNASGRYARKIHHYALPSLIFQALNERRVSVSSQSLVWRRYASLTQVIDICLELAKIHKFICFESGGILVELKELAKEVASCMGVQYVSSPNTNASDDHYYSESNEYETLLHRFGVKPLSLEQQIRETWLGVQEALSYKN